MCKDNWYQHIDEKYIRDKDRFIRSMKAQLDTPRGFKSRSERAAKDGLEYLCVDIEKKQNFWFRLPCSHIKMITNSDFYKKVFHCYGCQVLMWEKEAKEYGMTFIKKVDGEKAEYLLHRCGHTAVIATSDVRNHPNRKCEQCYIKELASNADAKELDFISKVSNGSRKAIYRFRKCGHTHELYTQYVKTSEITCPTCDDTLKKRKNSRKEFSQSFVENFDEEQFDLSILAQRGRRETIEKWKLEANEKNLIFLCKDKDIVNYGWYQLPCGHIRRISITNVRKCKDIKNIVCFTCMEESRKKSAKEKGLELLEVINGDKGLYRFIKCGHTREVFLSDVERHDNIICRDCTIEKWKDEAKQAGLTFIKKTQKKKALYKCTHCGSQQEFFIVAVRNKEFTCKGCLET